MIFELDTWKLIPRTFIEEGNRVFVVGDDVLLPMDDETGEVELERVGEYELSSFEDVLCHVHPKVGSLVKVNGGVRWGMSVSYPRKGIINLSPKHFLMYSLFLVSAVG